MKRKLPYILAIVLLVAGLAVLFYPAISSWYNAQYQVEAITGYDEAVALLRQKRIDEEFRMAKEYNDSLNGSGIKDPFVADSGMVLPDNYYSILDMYDGTMGHISIPEINVNLPIYHGIDSAVLEKGVGHIEMTAFPIGGEGNHSVLTAHTGLSNAILFNDLIDLELGDKFYIKILNETFAYKVDNIVVVEPSDTSNILPVEGEDRVTLITCTPYGVNSHRLLVQGIRIPYNPEERNSLTANSGSAFKCEIIFPFAVLILILIIIIIWIIVRKKKNKEKEE